MKDDVKKDWGKIAEQDDEDNNKDGIEVQAADDASEDAPDELKGQESLGFPDIGELEQKLTASEQKAHENWEKSVRAMAELDNVRRRAERDVANAHKYGNDKFIDALLPIIDSLEQALQAGDEEGESSGVAAMKEGVGLTLKLFADVFEKFGVKQLCPLGEKFDPQVHEAISMVPMPDKEPNTVIDVIQNGYLLNDRVVRPARVIIAKAS